MTETLTPRGRTWPHSLRSFASRDFRLLWFAAIVSSSGTQMQLAALGWVVALLTESATKVGLIAFAGVIPLLILSPVGGSFADRFPRRKVLLITQTVQMIQAFVLWGTWVAGLRSFWLLFAFAMVGGITAALNAPVWQAFIPSLVPRRDLPNAVMLNSTQFNISKALGPVVAGLLLVNTAGASWCFLLNALSFTFVLVALLSMHGPAHGAAAPAPARGGYWRDFVEGLAYVRREPGLRTAIGTNAFTAFVSQPIVPLIPVIALEMFDATAVQYGLLASAFGLGAILGALVLGRLDGRRLPSAILATGFVVYTGFVVALGLAPTFVAGLGALVGVGCGFLMVIATNNSCIQHLSSDAMRGRVMGIWLTSFGLFNPLGVLVQGVLADAIGIRLVLVIDGALLGVFLAWSGLTHRLRHLDTEEATAHLNVGPVDPEENG
jgi:MFS family permease